jgi:hypothetical protein
MLNIKNDLLLYPLICVHVLTCCYISATEATSQVVNTPVVYSRNPSLKS